MNTLAAAVADSAAAAAPAWQASLAVVLAALGALLWQVVESRKSRKAITSIASTADRTEAKVTSNHGHDNIGDKIDVMTEILPAVVTSVAEVRQALATHIADCEAMKLATDTAALHAQLDIPLRAPRHNASA